MTEWRVDDKVGADDLQRCLNALEQMSYEIYELVYVQHSTNDMLGSNDGNHFVVISVKY